MKFPVFLGEAVINTFCWFLQVDKLLAKNVLNISISPPYTHSQLVLLKTSTEFNYSNSENINFLKELIHEKERTVEDLKSQVTVGGNHHPANGQ